MVELGSLQFVVDGVVQIRAIQLTGGWLQNGLLVPS